MILTQEKKRKIFINNSSKPSHELPLKKLQEKANASLFPFHGWGNCGDTIYLFIEREKNQIKWAFFAAEQQACSLTAASANILCCWMENKTIADVEKEITNFESMIEGKKYQLSCFSLEIFVGLNKFPSRKECINLVIRSIKSSLKLNI